MGADPVAATNCLNFGNPEKPEIMAQLIEAIEGIGEACRHFGTPITGGNVSLYNETLGEAIYPTPVLGVVGLLADMEVPLGIHFQQSGRKVVLLGGLLPGSGDQLERRFGSSQYAKVILGRTWGLPPALDMDYEKRVHDAMREIARAGLAESAHDVSDGGLAVAVAESCFGASGIGARLRIESELPAHYLLFHEAPSRILLSLSSDAGARVLEIAGRFSVAAPVIGETVSGQIAVSVNGEESVRHEIDVLKASWDGSLEKLLESR